MQLIHEIVYHTKAKKCRATPKDIEMFCEGINRICTDDEENVSMHFSYDFRISHNHSEFFGKSRRLHCRNMLFGMHA